MYIHLGDETIIRVAEIVAIFDIAIESTSKLTKQYTTRAIEDKRAEIIKDGAIKSIVVTKDKIYFSPISSITLKKRANQHLVIEL